MDSWLSWAQERAVSWLPRVAAALALMTAFSLAGALASAAVARFGQRTRRHRDAVRLLGRTVWLAFLSVGAVTALGTAGVNVSGLVAGLGLTGFALGMALKDIVSNLLAGMLILIYRPFRTQDRIAVTGIEGTVVAVDLRYTTLESQDKRFLIPNSTLFTNPITVVRQEPRAGGA